MTTQAEVTAVYQSIRQQLLIDIINDLIRGEDVALTNEDQLDMIALLCSHRHVQDLASIMDIMQKLNVDDVGL